MELRFLTMAVRGAAVVLSQLITTQSRDLFPCDPVRPERPEPMNVTEIHPGHVSVVMAMGDSMTAAFAADSLFNGGRTRLGRVANLPLEYRDLSFSGGVGSDHHWTLPYFFKHYNASLVGASAHRTLPQTPGTGYLQGSSDALNVALSNSHSSQLWMQVEELQNQSRTIPDFDRRWKLLSILVGANDICDGSSTGFEACDGDTAHMVALADHYEQNLRATLVRVRDSFNNVIVHIISLFSLASVMRARSGHVWCDVRRKLFAECNCLDKPFAVKSGPVNNHQLELLDRTVFALNERVHSVVADFNLQRPDFAVVESAALKSQIVPDITYLSNLDCFHPSSLAHASVARLLWNELFDRQKRPSPLNSSTPLFCPTADSVIQVGSLPHVHTVLV